MSRNVLIYTVGNDFHANVIGNALKLRGNHIFRWVGEEYPRGSTASISFHDKKSGVILKMSDLKLSSDDVDVVWFRRRMLPEAPAIVDRRDSEFSTSELRTANSANFNFLESSFWINTHSSAGLCDLKPVQLNLATAAGLNIPSTLVSNDPVEIRDFISSVKVCIYKPLSGGLWSEGGRLLNSYTAEVDVESLPGDEILQSTPGIFQEKIIKSFEVRVQFFGNFYGAIRIESSSLRNGDLDWRIDQDSISFCAPLQLPQEVFESCRSLMKALGIVSGAFDFIVDTSGRWFFMEVNEAGQFLFVEAWCQKLPLLDAFCQFVEMASEEFVYDPGLYKFSYIKACELATQAGIVS
jgi:glutathione synthase/RimK-type ligase-like ATP-grasp enzyme